MNDDGKPYSLQWLKFYRAEAFAKMIALVRGGVSETQRRRRATLAKLTEKINRLASEIKKNCTHPLESQTFREYGREDTLGNWKRGMDMKIRCEGCGVTLEEWSE